MPCRLVLTFICLASHALLGGPVGAQTPLTSTGELDKKSERKIAEITKRLNQIVETKFSSEPMPLAAFLKKLEEQLPKNQKVSLRIDVDAFGKDAAEVAKTPIKLRLYPTKMSLGTILRYAASKLITDQEIDCRVYPTHYAITTSTNSVYPAAYDVRDLVKETLPKLRKMNATPKLRKMDTPSGNELLSFDSKTFKPGKEAESLAQMILETVSRRSVPVDIEIRNNTQLVIRTNHLHHGEIAGVLKKRKGEKKRGRARLF